MADEKNDEAQQAAEQMTKVNFVVKRIYVKDLSFESPNGIEAFRNEWKPKVNQDLNTQVNRIDETHFEVVLNMTVTVKHQDDKTAFLVEVHQAGIFEVSGIEGAQLQHFLSTMCPSILFPYLREAIDGLASRGGFPALMLPPINFEAVYAQAMQEAQKGSAANTDKVQ